MLLAGFSSDRALLLPRHGRASWADRIAPDTPFTATMVPGNLVMSARLPFVLERTDWSRDQAALLGAGGTASWHTFSARALTGVTCGRISR